MTFEEDCHNVTNSSALKKIRKLHRRECPEGLRTHDNDNTQTHVPPFLSLSFPLPLFFPFPSSFSNALEKLLNASGLFLPLLV
jgi:hypothetical protein